MRIIIVLMAMLAARAALACETTDDGIIVERIAPRVWEVYSQHEIGILRWVLDGQHTTSPPDPRAEGAGGDGVRVRELWWKDWTGTEHQLLSCANCDLIEAVRMPGTTWAWSWTGPGYGMGRPRAPLMLVDDRLADLKVGERRCGKWMQFYQVVESYAPSAAMAPGSARELALVRTTWLTITTRGVDFHAEIEALADHERWTVYHGRAEALTVCDGGVFDGYETSLGAAWALPDCEPALANLYTYPPAQPWVELTSSEHPVRIRITSANDQPWVVIWNRAIDGKLKPYGRPSTNIELRLKGMRRSYHHTLEVR